jgi:hypothetical protein
VVERRPQRPVWRLDQDRRTEPPGLFNVRDDPRRVPTRPDPRAYADDRTPTVLTRGPQCPDLSVDVVFLPPSGFAGQYVDRAAVVPGSAQTANPVHGRTHAGVVGERESTGAT